MAFDGVRLWIANQDNDSVQVVTPGLGEAVAVSAPLRVGSRPGALLWDGTWLWIAMQGDNTLRVLDPLVCERRNTPGAPFSLQSCTVSAPIPVGNLTQALAFTGDQLWVANYSDLTVQALDLVAAFSINVGTSPRRLAYTEIGGRPQLWVANQGSNDIQSIDLDANGDPLSGLANLAYRTGAQPRSLAFDGRTMWITNSSDNQVLSMNAANGNWITRTRTDRGPRGILYEAAGNRLWVANNGADTVQSVNAETGIAGPAIPVDRGPFDLAYDGERIWVSSSVSYTVQSIDPASQTAGDPIDVCGNPGAMAFDGTWLWVACYDDNLLLLIDPETGEYGPVIGVGAGPSGLAYDAANQRMWVANFRDSSVQWVTLDPGEGPAYVSPPIRVDSGPIFALFARGKLWVTNFNVGRVQYVVARETGE
jgi:DNA-binding beta-propeller fold protein YncE